MLGSVARGEDVATVATVPIAPVATQPDDEPAIRAATRSGDAIELVQNEEPSAVIPQMPDTNVQAPPPAPPQIPYTGDRVQVPSILQGTVFDSPTPTGYVATSATVGSIINIPNMSMPATVNTVTPGLIKDQQDIRLDEVLRDIGGAVKSFGGDGFNRPDTFFLRGLEMSQFNYRKNGYLDPTFTPRDFANISRIDVIKGPASVVYGSSLPSGTLNVVTKQPLYNRYDYGTVQFGSFGLQRYTVDSTGPVAGNQDVLYRINAAYQNNDGFRDFYFNERTFVSPVITWVIDDGTTLTWEGEYLNDRRRYDSGTIALNGNTQYFPINRYYGDPNDRQTFYDYRSTLTFRTELSDNWTFMMGESSVFYGGDFQGTLPGGSPPVPLNIFTGGPINPASIGPTGLYQGGDVNRNYQNGFLTESNHDVLANLAGVVETDRATHNLLVGTEQNWLLVNQELLSQSIPYVPNTFFAPPPVLFPLDPNYAINPATNGPFPRGSNASSFNFVTQPYYQTRNAVYAQDFIELNEQWKVLVGGRWDHLNVNYGRSLSIAGAPVFAQQSNDTYDNGTARVGLVYAAIPDVLSYYAMYSESFNPPAPANFGFTLQPLRPELGHIWEGGVKTQLLDNLYYTIGGFYIERTNVATQLDNFQIVQVDGQRSQGVEMNLNGQFTRRWSAMANYTYNDVNQTVATGATSLTSGLIRGVPFNSGNVWTRYDLVQTQRETIGVALGLVAVGQRRGDYTSPLVLSGYDRWDSGFYYRRGRFDANIYWENMFNEQYASTSITQFTVIPGYVSNMRFMAGMVF
jgi:iron complex outermembrane receptor protein